jgi:hypothetical protein
MAKRYFSAADAAFLDQYRGNWDTLRISGYIRHLDPGVKNEFLAIYRRSLDPRIVVCMHCQEDYLSMIRVLYTNFEAWEAETQAQPAAPSQELAPIDPPAPDPVDAVPFPDVLDTITPDQEPSQEPVQKKRGRKPKK